MTVSSTPCPWPQKNPTPRPPPLGGEGEKDSSGSPLLPGEGRGGSSHALCPRKHNRQNGQATAVRGKSEAAPFGFPPPRVSARRKATFRKDFHPGTCLPRRIPLACWL